MVIIKQKYEILNCFLQEACCAYVLMVTAVYWVSEAVPLGAAALVPAFLYPLFGVLKSSEASSIVLYSIVILKSSTHSLTHSLFPVVFIM